MLSFLREFRKLEAASAIVLMAVTALAMIIANSPAGVLYEEAISWPVSLGLGPASGQVPVSLIINDALMVLFFLLVGLEIKAEILHGELSTRAKAMLPACAALGGVLAPALIYAALNWGQPTMRGWAIPAATDIAFSLGVLALFGNRIKPSLKIFLMALAVIDDLAAVIIIALFYTENISGLSLLAAVLCLAGLHVLARLGIRQIWPYAAFGLFLWLAVLTSGVHATIAGVLLAFMMPIQSKGVRTAPGKRLMKMLHPWVAFAVIPIFAFANGGVNLAGIDMARLSGALPLGIILGLFIGKPLGIVLTSWVLVKLRMAELPSQSDWLEFIAVASIAGIGFTMSLFIGVLAFDNSAVQLTMRSGVIAGSLLSALAGSFLMWVAVARK